MSKIITLKAHTKVMLAPCAKKAFKWMREYPFLIDHTKLLEGFTQPFLSSYLYAVERTEIKAGATSKVLHIYGPLPTVLFWQNSEPIAGTKIIVESAMTDEQIEEQVWISALSMLIFSIDKSQLFWCRDSLSESMPSNLHQKFLGKKKLSYVDLSMLAGCATNTLKQQKKRSYNQIRTNTLTKANIIDYLSENTESKNKEDNNDE